MKCPHCFVSFHAEWAQTTLNIPYLEDRYWMCGSTTCPDCNRQTIELVLLNSKTASLIERFRVYLRGHERAPVDEAVPESFRSDYVEACNVQGVSPKASAALARRVLQGILTDQGYESTNLAQQIASVLKEDDPKKVLPDQIRKTVDAVRHFGNFAAHPITELTSLQIIEVEPEEAEWCLEIIETLFDHYYVTPARAQERREQLNQKLAQAGKKPARS